MASKPQQTPEQRFDRDGWAASEALLNYLSMHSAAPADAADARADAVAAVTDWLTDDETAEAYRWSKKRAALAQVSW